MTDKQEPGARRWMEDAEDALTRTTEALRAAWEGTRETRMSTLEAAREAAAQLGKAIDQGLDVARESWGGRGSGTTPDEGPEADQVDEATAATEGASEEPS